MPEQIFFLTSPQLPHCQSRLPVDRCQNVKKGKQKEIKKRIPKQQYFIARLLTDTRRGAAQLSDRPARGSSTHKHNPFDVWKLQRGYHDKPFLYLCDTGFVVPLLQQTKSKITVGVLGEWFRCPRLRSTDVCFGVCYDHRRFYSVRRILPFLFPLIVSFALLVL